MIPSAGFFCKSLICFTMAFTVADERCSISSFLSRGGCWVGRNLIFWNQQTTKTLPVFAQEKRNAQQARDLLCCCCCCRSQSFSSRKREFQSVGVFSLSPFVGGVNFFLLFSAFFSLVVLPKPYHEQTLNTFLVSFVPSLKREKTSAFSTSNTSRAVYLCTFLRLLSQLE